MAAGRAVIAAVVLFACPSAHAGGVTTAVYGTTKAGRTVTAYTLANDRGASVTILDYGATIAAIRVPDRRGVLGNAVLSFADLAGWERVGHANAIVGRVANRITRGFTLDGVHYPLTQNAQGATNHSGPDLYTTRIWRLVSTRGRDGAAITLDLDSPDGDQGFPGHVRIRATYRFGNDDALRLDMIATTDRATPINLTNHIYFNLSGDSATSVADQQLQIGTDRTAVMEPGSAPTGAIVPVAGTPFDFRRPTAIGRRVPLSLGRVYDDAATAPPVPAGMVRSFSRPYVLNGGERQLNMVAARLYDPASGRVMELRTTETTVHLFTPASMPAGLLSDTGRPFARLPAVALETQHLPDSPNHPDFPSIILRPGQVYRSTTIFAFSTDEGRAAPEH